MGQLNHVALQFEKISTGWWFQIVKFDHFPNFRIENKQKFELPPASLNLLGGTQVKLQLVELSSTIYSK